jgi:hypothetical protein
MPLRAAYRKLLDQRPSAPTNTPSQPSPSTTTSSTGQPPKPRLATTPTRSSPAAASAAAPGSLRSVNGRVRPSRPRARGAPLRSVNALPTPSESATKRRLEVARPRPGGGCATILEQPRHLQRRRERRAGVVPGVVAGVAQCIMVTRPTSHACQGSRVLRVCVGPSETPLKQRDPPRVGPRCVLGRSRRWPLSRRRAPRVRRPWVRGECQRGHRRVRRPPGPRRPRGWWRELQGGLQRGFGVFFLGCCVDDPGERSATPRAHREVRRVRRREDLGDAVDDRGAVLHAHVALRGERARDHLGRLLGRQVADGAGVAVDLRVGDDPPFADATPMP